MISRLAFCFLATIAVLKFGGCHQPTRQNGPVPSADQWESEWRKALPLGLKTDRALSYLLTHGFDCKVTRNEKSVVERVLATRPTPLRDASGVERDWVIDLTIQEDAILAVKILSQ